MNKNNENEWLDVYFHCIDRTVLVNGQCYSLYSIHNDHPVLKRMNRKQLFDFAFVLGGDIRAYQCRSMFEPCEK
ncbi:MAG: hypothetical protein JKY66_05410 [Spongiibacteraceae bacterium]|nr:hypothetical protein [Spongiibacteraceae bacterium]